MLARRADGSALPGQEAPLVTLRLPRPAALALVLLALLPGASRGQEAWRSEVDRLTDRWADDAGPRRLERAMQLLRNQVRLTPSDGELHLELARLELARLDRALELARLAQARQAEEGSALDAEVAQAAVASADEAARLLSDDRKAVALAVGYLGATYGLHAALRRVESDAAACQQLLAARQPELDRRRQELFAACDEERAQELLRVETERRTRGRHLDRLGTAPGPIGGADLSGQPVDLASYRGKVLLVLFWASWSPACAEVLDAVVALERELGPAGLAVVGINLDHERAAFDAAVKERGLAFRQVHDGQGLRNTVARAWGVWAVPEGVLLDHTGRVRYVNPWNQSLELAVRELLERRDRARAAGEGR